jgi:RNA polymerase sigma factor (sigma-70 family)
MGSSQVQDVPLSAIEQYLRGVKLTRPLLDEEEAQLLQCIERGKDEQTKHSPNACILRDAEQARTRLIEGYQALLISLAKRYVRHCREMELLDLVQEGNLGLLQAIEKFKSKADSCSFRTWVFSWVRGCMLLALTRYEGAIRLPLEKMRIVRRMEMANTRLLAVLGREPTIEEIAIEMNASKKERRDLIVLQEHVVLSIHAFPLEDEDCPLEDAIVDPCESNNDDEDLRDLLRDALVMLPDRERFVINLRYGFDDGRVYSLKEVAYLLGVSTARVAGLHRRAQVRLRKMLCVA